MGIENSNHYEVSDIHEVLSTKKQLNDLARQVAQPKNVESEPEWPILAGVLEPIPEHLLNPTPEEYTWYTPIPSSEHHQFA